MRKNPTRKERILQTHKEEKTLRYISKTYNLPFKIEDDKDGFKSKTPTLFFGHMNAHEIFTLFRSMGFRVLHLFEDTYLVSSYREVRPDVWEGFAFDIFLWQKKIITQHSYPSPFFEDGKTIQNAWEMINRPPTQEQIEEACLQIAGHENRGKLTDEEARKIGDLLFFYGYRRGATSSIADTLECGYGELNEHGFWEFPCTNKPDERELENNLEDPETRAKRTQLIEILRS